MSPPDRTSDLARRPDARPRRALSPQIWLFVAAVGAVHLLTVMGMDYYGPFMLFAPAFLLFIPFFGLRILTHPIPVFCIFLVIIVNLDFFRIPETRLTADILTSSIVLYAVLVRLFLSGKLGLRNPVEKVYLAYLAVTFMSVVLSVNVASSVKNWGRDLEYWVFFLFLFSVPMIENDRRAVAKAAVFSTLIPCVLGVAGMIFGIDAFYGEITPIAGGEAVHRISATLNHPVTLSHYLAFTSVVTLSLVIDGRWIARRTLMPIFLLQLAILYFTYGRTGWAELMVSTIVLFWIRGMRKVVFGILPALTAVLFALIPSFLARIQNSFEVGDNSLLWRFGLWAYALAKFPQKPIFGSGQDTFIEYVAFGDGFAAHHTWINLLIETGLLGVIAFLVLQITVGRTMTRARRDPRTAKDPLLLGVYAGWIGTLVGSFAGDPFNLPAISIYFWTLLAVALRGPQPERAVE